MPDERAKKPAARCLRGSTDIRTRSPDSTLAAGMIACLLMGTQALAEDRPNPAPHVQAAGRFEESGALPEGTGVLNRARPEYDASGIPVAGFVLYPTFAASFSSDDNVYRAPAAQVSDIFWTLSPRLDLRSQWPDDALQLYGQFDDYRYASHDTESRTNWVVGSAGELLVAAGTTLDANASYFSTHESRSSPDISTNALSPTAYTQFHTDAAITSQPGPLGLSAGVSYDRYEFDPTALIGGGLLDNADRNSKIVDAFTKASYELGVGRSVYVRASYNVRDFDLQFDKGGFDRSSDGYRLDTGLQVLLSPLIKATMFVGYLQQNFKPPLHNVSGVDFGSQIDWYVTELVTLHLTAARQLVDTTLSGASSEDERSIRASFDYELLRNLILQGNAGYENDIFDGVSRDDHLVTAGFGARYLLNRQLSVYADYAHNMRDSNLANSDFADNMVTAGVRLQY